MTPHENVVVATSPVAFIRPPRWRESRQEGARRLPGARVEQSSFPDAVNGNLPSKRCLHSTCTRATSGGVYLMCFIASGRHDPETGVLPKQDRR